ncbi:hypothetical protein [Dyadobacter luticola]|uniref:DUF4157 domain-containing protein n=1 Tax=Dyadobacter luticola TaxID=1979387 RepID=A0A5R9KXJ0_9BACT|nr:hypothetical protein [Dyadobacter luticola]TLV00974.1 hypothetical protein FEN17_16040 [Dyadobacter luticola]
MKFKGFVFSISSLRVEGIALFPFIFIRTKTPGRFLINHERIHIRQQLEMGILPFYIWYLMEYFIRYVQHKNRYLAYLHISFEREAYRNETNLSYLGKRPFWAFLKYLKQ